MDIFQAVEVDPLNSQRIQQHLNKIREAQSSDGDLGEAISAAVQEFNQFFLNYGKPYFKQNSLDTHIGTPKSALYNETMETLKDDLERLYEMSSSAAAATLAAYNYSSISAEEIKNTAAEAASKVLDLNILNNFVKGQVIVAGDDFLDTSKIDTSIQAETAQAEIIDGASSIGLKIDSAERVSLPDKTNITITPLAPAKKDGDVNKAPTPNNLERFYEGHFFASIGEQRPEGGQLQLKYVVDPADLPLGAVQKVTTDGNVTSDEGVAEAKAAADGGQGFYAIVPASEENLLFVRQQMIDGNPETFWEAEFVYAVPDLIEGASTKSITASEKE